MFKISSYYFLIIIFFLKKPKILLLHENYDIFVKYCELYFSSKIPDFVANLIKSFFKTCI